MSAEIVRAVSDRLDGWKSHRTRMDRIHAWYRGNNDKPWMPPQSTLEYKELQSRAVNRFLQMIVSSFTEVLYVDGYTREDGSDNEAGWRFWQANGLDAYQQSVHEAAMAYERAYVVVLPGELAGEPMPSIEARSARSSIAYYANSRDPWPMNFMWVTPGIDQDDKHVWHIGFVDSNQIHRLSTDSSMTKVTFETSQEHGVGFCPVVQFPNKIDLEGHVEGEIEPLIPIASRIDQDIFDRLVVQRFGAHKVRWATGMVEPETDSEKRAVAQLMRVGDILMNESTDARFGTLDETPVSGYIDAYKADIQELATVSKVPPHWMLGSIANLSAEALAAAEASFSRKVEARKHTFGEAWEQVLRLGALIVGDTETAADMSSQVRWRNMESRSLAQVADALTKLGQAGVPVQLLAKKYMPDWTQQDMQALERILEEGDAVGNLLAQIGSDFEPTA